MKKFGMMTILAVAALASMGLSGCKKEAKASPEAALKQAAEKPAAALPSAQVPKDHPAH